MKKKYDVLVLNKKSEVSDIVAKNLDYKTAWQKVTVLRNKGNTSDIWYQFKKVPFLSQDDFNKKYKTDKQDISSSLDNHLVISKQKAVCIAKSLKNTSEENNINYSGAGLDFLNKVERATDELAFDNLDSLKDSAISLRETISNTGGEFENLISDILFTIEVDYQCAHNLDENNWNKLEKEIS